MASAGFEWGAVTCRPMQRFVASGFGVGLLPRRLWGSDNGAGTVGAVLAAIVSALLWPLPWWSGALAFVAAFLLSLWSVRPFSADGADPGWVAIDEIAGTLFALIGLAGWPWLVSLVVARAADIFKVLPGVKQAEALPGALGVTMDDIVAGTYGLAAGWLTTWLL